VNPQKENSQTDKKSENVGRGRGRARPLRSEVTTNQSSKQPSFPAYLRLTRLPSASNILFCKSIKPAFDLKQSKPINIQIIYPGTIVALLSPVQEVVNPNSKIDEEGELRTDLINLLERTQEHLIPKQSSEVKRLLRHLGVYEVVVLLDVHTL
jgi:hypothetical protein